MLKHIHLLFVALVIILFIGRVLAARFKPELLAAKWLNIAPHVFATLLLLTGFGLVMQGNWLAGDYGWIVAKFIMMFVFIGLGMLAMKLQGDQRWYAFAGALLCVVYIIKVAFTKQVLFFG